MIARVVRYMLDYPARSIAWGGAVALAIGLLAWFAVDNAFATDFSVYHRAANEPDEYVYIERPALPFPYAPTMLLWLIPLEGAPMWPAFALWVGFSALVLFSACRRYLTVEQSLLVVLSPPLVNCLGTGQVSAAMAALLLISCGASNRVLAGVGFGIIASVKPQLVVMAPLFLLFSKDWRALVAAGATFLIAVGLSVAVFGSVMWLEWLGSLEHFRLVLNLHNVVSVASTPAGVAERFGFNPLPFLILGAGVGVYLVYRLRRSSPMVACAAIGGGSLLAAPYALTYDLAPVIPFLVWSLYRGSVLAAVALSGAAHPFPIVLTTIRLLRGQHAEKNLAGSQQEGSLGVCAHRGNDSIVGDDRAGAGLAA